jgi:aryl-alcohol dehydrogenase-like predicted oxidoreductase
MPDPVGSESFAAAHPAIGGIRLVFGGNVFGWTLNPDQSFAVLDAFYEAGGRMIDSAEGYSSWIPGNKGGESETIIGAWLSARGVRKDMRIATKTGMGGPPGGLRPEKVAAALAGSLERLRTDYVDLYYAHRDDPLTPLDEVASGYEAVVQSGQVRELGASNFTCARLEAALAAAARIGATPYTVYQPQYNLAWRNEFEGAMQRLCAANAIAVLPYYGLASGFLTGKFRAASDWAGSSRAQALDQYAAKGGWPVLAIMDRVAAETGATLAQIALAWLNAQPTIAAPLASATSPAQIRDLCGAVSVTLNADQLHQLNDAMSSS